MISFRGTALLGRSNILEKNSMIVVDKATGKIVAVEKDEAKKDFSSFFPIPSSSILLPAFVDSHCHPHGGGIQMMGVDLRGAGGLKECIVRLVKRALGQDGKGPPPESGSWLCGGGWALGWFDRGYPVADDFDAKFEGEEEPKDSLLLPKDSLLLLQNSKSILSQFCIFLRDGDGHQAWVNRRALEKIDFSSPLANSLIRQNLIDFDANGHPSGYFKEAGVDLIKNILPSLSLPSKLAALSLAHRKFAHQGVGSVFDAAVTRTSLETYIRAASNNELLLRGGGAMLYNPKESLEENLKWMTAGRDSCRSLRYFKLDTVKLMVDGIIENNTSLLLDDYSHPADFGKGRSNFSLPELVSVIEACYDHKLHIHCHTIGDGATRLLIDAIKIVKERKIGSEFTPRITAAHLQLVSDEDIAELKRLGIFCNFSPFWVRRDLTTMTAVLTKIGRERWKNQYKIRTIAQDHRDWICFGSDWPVSSLDPLLGIAVAATHRHPLVDEMTEFERRELLPQRVRGDEEDSCGCEDRSEAVARFASSNSDDTVVVSPADISPLSPYLPNETVSVTDAIEFYTAGGARAWGMENELGSIEVGKFGDFVVIDRNILDPAMPIEQLAEAKIVATIVGGEFVFRDESWEI